MIDVRVARTRGLPVARGQQHPWHHQQCNWRCAVSAFGKMSNYLAGGSSFRRFLQRNCLAYPWATTGVEMRAFNNVNWGPVARPGVGMDGLTSWGPTINLIRAPNWGRNQETPSSDPYVLSRYAVQVSRGMQEGEDPRYLMVGTTLKHFGT
jgi:hypothetical protein